MKRPNEYSKPLEGVRIENYHPRDLDGQYVKDLNKYIDYLENNTNKINYKEDLLELNTSNIIKKCLNYYNYINQMGFELSKIIEKEIEPLLSEAKYDEAKKMVRNFYKKSSDSAGEIIFIEYDLILAKINRLKNEKDFG